jgi:hypothetical protein
MPRNRRKKRTSELIEQCEEEIGAVPFGATQLGRDVGPGVSRLSRNSDDPSGGLVRPESASG